MGNRYGRSVSSEQNDYQKEKSTQGKGYEITPPCKRRKISGNFEVDKTFHVSKDDVVARATCSPKAERAPCTKDKDANFSTTNDKTDSATNPLPLRKRRLPASFWQEPGKSEIKPPIKVESSPRQTAFLPISPRQSSSFGRYVKDFLGSNLSASEKLELLRLNSLERDSYNHLCSTREISGRRCPSYPCVLMHCKNQHEEIHFRDFPPFYPRNDYPFLHPTQGASLPFPARNAFSSNHERHANVLGMPYPPSFPPYYPDLLRHNEVIDSNYGSRFIFPMETNVSPLFPLSSHFNPSVVRPVPKKHLSNISRSFHPSFDVR
ncbi:hypothetical protein BSL78_19036 [Apostichopus japonicus]|uniref:Uncharacterized protein n=1 Tax=Stichopus japonicus TaxID=307972 RepID=A0A2G8K7X8_STIJA|nr:hypothetical protein BSL78_19036 [Apostichopus japonicus]